MTDSPAMLSPGYLIGELEILRVLDSGTFSITYQVKDTVLGTSYTLKEYFPASHALRVENGSVEVQSAGSKQAFADGLEQFLAEARLVAGLDHPGIVRVIRYFEANNTAYILMSWQQGRPLDVVLRDEGTLDHADASKLMLSLLDALEYLHQKELLHLDIKPSNIYVTEDGNPLLLDFGAAAVGSEIEAVDGSGLGSKGYAAPEQSELGGKLGPRTDFYALAATLYRCISSRVPVDSALRSEALRDGKADPLQPASELLEVSQYGGLLELIDHGMQMDSEARPLSVSQWRKSFESLDWRLLVATKKPAEFEQEGREWLPIILLGLFLITMAVVAVFLLTDDAQVDQQASLDSSVVQSTESTSGQRQEDRVPPAPIPAEETLRWEAALDADTVLGYRQFMQDFPESIYREQAQLQLDILDDRAWQMLSGEDTRPAYEDYLEEFPSGRHSAEALVRIDEIDQALAKAERERIELERQDEAAWATAKNERSISSMDQYINQWPAGQHIDEAGELRRKLQDELNEQKAFELAMQLNTRESFQAYIDAFPQGAQVTQALEMIDGLTFRPGKEFRDCEDCPEMIVVPGGSFWQGSNDSSPWSVANEKPKRLVSIADQFAVARYEVSMDQWDACLADKGCDINPTDNGWGRGSRPVMMVSWSDAQQYVQWLRQKTGQDYRLPSESEWEYFARAGEESEWLGGSPSGLCEFGNVAGSETGFNWQHKDCADDQNLGTLPAGSMRANGFGLFDVIGNVSEWTSDCMNLSYLDAPVDGSAWGRGICSSHLTRGGSWVTGTNEVRLPARFNLKNGDRNDFTGFRVVRSVEQ
ncbi:MAG: sulfatase activating formylglycine-generating enzyme [Bacteroidia bacterium]|jgi:formylglycine-generating enzyme required for sulfatase activity